MKFNFFAYIVSFIFALIIFTTSVMALERYSKAEENEVIVTRNSNVVLLNFSTFVKSKIYYDTNADNILTSEHEFIGDDGDEILLRLVCNRTFAEDELMCKVTRTE